MKTEWEKVTLGDVATIQTGVAKNDGYSGETVEIPYLRVANVQDGFLDLSEIKKIKIPVEKKNRFLLQKGDVIMTEGGDFDKLGRGTIWDGQISPCAHQNHLFVVRTDCTKLNPFFLSYLSASSYGRLYFRLSSKQSTNLASINSTQLSHFPILLPPLEEQNKIIEILSTWDSAIEKTEKLISKKEKLYKGYLKYFYIETGNCIKLSEFAEETSRRNKSKELTQVLSVTNKNGFVPPEQQFGKKIASEDLSNYKIIMKGQFAYNPSRINVGSIARLDEYISAVLSPMYTVFEINNKIINSNYFLHWLSSKYAIHQIKLCAQGGVREIVSFEDFKKMKIKSLPLEKQEKIADFLNLQKSEISLLKKQLEQYKLQKQGLMQKLLTGEWRVR